MKTYRHLIFACALVVPFGAQSAFAQNTRQEKPETKVEQDIIIERNDNNFIFRSRDTDVPPIPPNMPMTGFGDTMSFRYLSSEMSFDGKVVKGAPYSAEAVTETTQTLADGNRIVRKQTANLYRDGEGRTRRDQTLSVLGPFATDGEPPQTSFINDPVAGVNYVLDARTRTARKLPSFKFDFKGFNASSEEMKRHAEEMKRFGEEMKRFGEATARGANSTDANGKRVVPPAPPKPPMAPLPPTAPMPPLPGEMGEQIQVLIDKEVRPFDSRNRKTEKLGKQTVEGVEAEGTRTTVTIPAGEIGNERPIEIVSERWYSPDLQTVVMTRRNDPRNGETVYRLTNIVRREPARSVFEVPSDYTIKDAPARRNIRIMKPAENKQEEKK